MSIYNQQTKSGEMWLRSLNTSIKSVDMILSSIALKYQPVNYNFYSDINNNTITRFDVFYDNIFLETQTGYIFEKIVYDGNSILPYHNNNNLKLRNYIPCDYWFDEINFKVYIAEVKALPQTKKDIFDFYLVLNEFDCKTGLIETVYKHYIAINIAGSSYWNTTTNDYPIIEKPKICYNKDTKNYNISFLIRNNNVYKIGIISVNLKNIGEFNTVSINGMIPFCNSVSLSGDQNLLN